MEDTRSIVLEPGEKERLIQIGMEVLEKLDEVDVLLARLVEPKGRQEVREPTIRES